MRNGNGENSVNKGMTWQIYTDHEEVRATFHVESASLVLPLSVHSLDPHLDNKESHHRIANVSKQASHSLRPAHTFHAFTKMYTRAYVIHERTRLLV